jgi:hypothetical protein
MIPIRGTSNLYTLENSGSNSGLAGTGKELIIERTAVTLASNAATDVETRFAPGEVVYVIPCYQLTVESDGTIDPDFSALPDTDIEILVLGKGRQLAGTD